MRDVLSVAMDLTSRSESLVCATLAATIARPGNGDRATYFRFLSHAVDSFVVAALATHRVHCYDTFFAL